MAEFGDRNDTFSGLNAVGTAEYVGQRMGAGEGGNPMTGYLGQAWPTSIMAKGNDVSAKDDYLRGERKGMSTARNESKARMGRRR